VLDESLRPQGVVTIRDLVDEDMDGSTVDQRMSRPAICVSISATVEQAARQLAGMDMHHIVVVDGTGAAVGMLSTLDALRALLGLPARHPHTFPHWDDATEVSWTDEWALDADAAHHAPDGCGVLALTTGRLGERDAVLWAEAASNLRERVRRLAMFPEGEELALRKVLGEPNLRFRAAAVGDEDARLRIVSLLRNRIDATPAPGAT
jgi:hypothetical protein